MQVTFFPSLAKGRIVAPPSKSMAHRLLICAGLANGTSVIRGISPSEDVLATLDCLGALDAKCTLEQNTVTVQGIDLATSVPTKTLFCRESGSTLRFLIPVALLHDNPIELCGAPSLLKRPMGVYRVLCEEKGMQFLQSESGIRVKGKLPAGVYTLPGNVSSQFVSGLLYALPLIEGNSEIRLIPPVESRSYIDLTLAALKMFGVCVEWKDALTLTVPGNQHYCPRDAIVEGDYSNAAFLDAFTAIGGAVSVEGLFENSLQGDRVYRALFQDLMNGTPTVSIADCPDLGPILFTLAAALNGATFTDIGRLRIKESDRIACMKEELEKFGAKLTVSKDSVTVIKTDLHQPNLPLEGHNDHRVVMSMSVLASKYGGTVCGAEAVAKSYPNFFEQIQKIGIQFQNTHYVKDSKQE